MRYNPAQIEAKWQQIWEDRRVFEVSNDFEELKKKPKYYVLDMFPYPSGAGLHVGHPEGYTATDVIARLKRMQGFNVLHPMGWDAFGLPAERAAIRDNIHPAIITQRNIDNFRRQIKRLGFSYDWSREIDTSKVEFYQWTQWIFLKLYEKGLAYLAEIPVNWCPALGTVLANEEVKDGKYIETGDLVEKRLMRQWMLKITAYAERLLDDLDELDWPVGVKEMQRNWIGKSIGAHIKFDIENTPHSVDVFTTRADTLFGVTYCVLAPEHPLVFAITSAAQKEAVRHYVENTAKKSDQERQAESDTKTGVFTGAHAIHPITRQNIPIWIADYVLMGYGTGAIMGVPAHDERDHAFALAHHLDIIEVVAGSTAPISQAAYLGEGKLINSDFLNGLSVSEATTKIVDFLQEKAVGRAAVQFRLRDWLFSRQRYWGEPFPIVYIDDQAVPLAAEMLPVELPHLDDFTPTSDGEPPLARADKSWLEVVLPDGRVGRRETNTMPQWGGSCWYYLRFLDPHNKKEPWSKEAEQYWMPVDLYIGGVEHAVLHLLYSRFWHKVLYDCGLVHTKEPYKKLFNQGMILAQSYQDANGKYYYPEQIEQKNGAYFVKESGVSVVAQTEKMSKSRYNVINPDDVIAEYGADAMRLYELFMGPLEQIKPWQMNGVEGVYRFLHRVWRLVVDEETDAISPKVTDESAESAPELWQSIHRTIKKVEEDTLALRFNTAISQMMIFVNEASQSPKIPKNILLVFLQILSPYAPHICEELWQRLGGSSLLAQGNWPSFDPNLCESRMITIALQVNGKRRDEITVEKDIPEEELKQLALNNVLVQKFMENKPVRRVIVVPGKIVNIVV